VERSPEWNFAGRLFSRLRETSELIDAATGEVAAAADLRAGISSLAVAFARAGLEPGDRILIACKLNPATTLAYLAAIHAGLVAVPVDERSLGSSSDALVKAARARAAWTNTGSRCAWLPGEMMHFQGIGAASQVGPVPPVPRREDDPATLMPTSGSTGAPRLVKVSHGNLIANTEAIIRSQDLRHDDRALLILPISYCFGASVMHSHLYQGGAVVYDTRFMFPDKVLRAIGSYRCTTFAGVPTVYNILLRRSNIASIPLSPLRRLLQAGGPLAPEHIRRLRTLVPHAEFFVMYGQTEATSRISCLPTLRLGEKLGSVGLPLDNLSVRIVDGLGKDVSVGEPGEIWVHGKSVCDGYFDDPEETGRKFRGGWLATGDIASRDRDGFLWIVGRKSEFIKMRGIRVSFSEIETRVATAPGVSECAATMVQHAEAGEAAALYVVAEPGAQGVIAAVRRSIPAEWICDSVTLVPELPKNLHGKLNRLRLAEIARTERRAGEADTSELAVGKRFRAHEA
jgi:acyl-CoA synthetase (AMP-forming)/AMP-acid ligase II